MRNIFLEKSYAKYGKVTIPTSFSKKSKLGISLDQQPNVCILLVYFLYTVYFHYMPSCVSYLNILRLSCRPLAFTSYIFFFKKKKKEVWNQPSCLIISIIFEKIYFSRYILLADPLSLSAYLYCVRYWEMCVL